MQVLTQELDEEKKVEKPSASQVRKAKAAEEAIKAAAELKR